MKELEKVRQTIKKYLNEMLESGNYPPGAEHDPRAPYNDRSEDISVTKYQYVPKASKFIVSLSNGHEFEVNDIEALEVYWKKHPGSYEEQERMFGDDDLTSDANYLEYLEKRNPGRFSDILYNIGERNDQLGNDLI